MNQAFCVGVLDRLAALEAAVAAMRPAPAEACTEYGTRQADEMLFQPEKRKPGRPPKGIDHGTATPTA